LKRKKDDWQQFSIFNEVKKMIHLFFMVLIALACKSQAAQEWTLRNPIPPVPLNSVTWIGNQFIAVGRSSTILTSRDGIIWAERNWGDLQGAKNLSCIYASIDGEIVIVGQRESPINTMWAYTSWDGLSWTSREVNLPNASGFNGSIALASNTTCYVAVMTDYNPFPIIVQSQDGFDWKIVASNITHQRGKYLFNSVVWGNDKFVAVGDSGWVFASPDGTTWTKQDGIDTERLKGITWGDNQYVSVGKDGSIFASPDAITWTKRNSKTSVTLFCINWLNNQFIAGGDSGTILLSKDGIIWDTISSGVSYALTSIAYGAGQYVAVSNGAVGIISSPDGHTWTKRAKVVTINPLKSIALGESRYICVGDNGAIAASYDAISWTTMNSGTTANLFSIAWGNNRFIAVGDSGTIVSCSNDSSWKLMKTGAPYSLRSINYADSQFIVTRDSGRLETSPDGIVWTSRNAGTSKNINSVAYGNGRYIAVGEGGFMAYSSDCISWKNNNRDSSFTILSITWGNKGFVAVGKSPGKNSYELTHYGLILTSLDGLAWQSQPWRTDQDISDLVNVQWCGDKYIAFGISDIPTCMACMGPWNKQIASSDGVTWEDISEGLAQDPKAIVWGNNQLVLVGDSGTIWTSPYTATGTGVIKPLPQQTNYPFSLRASGKSLFVSMPVMGQKQTASIAICSIAGKGVRDSKLVFSNGIGKISIDNLPNGVYVLRVNQGLKNFGQKFSITR